MDVSKKTKHTRIVHYTSIDLTKQDISKALEKIMKDEFADRYKGCSIEKSFYGNSVAIELYFTKAVTSEADTLFSLNGNYYDAGPRLNAFFLPAVNKLLNGSDKLSAIPINWITRKSVDGEEVLSLYRITSSVLFSMIFEDVDPRNAKTYFNGDGTITVTVNNLLFHQDEDNYDIDLDLA